MKQLTNSEKRYQISIFSNHFQEVITLLNFFSAARKNLISNPPSMTQRVRNKLQGETKMERIHKKANNTLLLWIKYVPPWCDISLLSLSRCIRPTSCTVSHMRDSHMYNPRCARHGELVAVVKARNSFYSAKHFVQPASNWNRNLWKPCFSLFSCFNFNF